MLSRIKKNGGETNFPIHVTTGQTNFKVEVCACCSIAPTVAYILWLSKSQPLGCEGGSCSRQPQSKTTFTRKPLLPENQANFLQSGCDLASIQILCPSVFLYFFYSFSISSTHSVHNFKKKLRTVAGGMKWLHGFMQMKQNEESCNLKTILKTFLSGLISSSLR